MAKHARLPDGTVLSFPDDATQAEMDQIVNAHDAANGPPKAAAPLSIAEQAASRLKQRGVVIRRDPQTGMVSRPPVDVANEPPSTSWTDSASRFARGVGESLGVGSNAQAQETAKQFDPVEQAQRAWQAAKEGHGAEAFARGAQAALGPAGGMIVPLLQHAPEQMIDQADQAREALPGGSYVRQNPDGTTEVVGPRGEPLPPGAFSRATGHSLASIVPVVGPAAADAGELAGTDTPRAAGRATGLLAPFAAGPLLDRITPDTAPTVIPKSPVRKTLAEVTGSKPLAVAEKVVENSLPGSVVYNAFRKGAQQDVLNLAHDTAQKISGFNGTPEQLGEHISQKIGEAKVKLNQEANQMHSAVDQEASPTLRQVTVPSYRSEPTGLVQSDGTPIMRQVAESKTALVPDPNSGVWVDTTEWKKLAADLKQRYDDPNLAVGDSDLSAVRGQLDKVLSLDDKVPWNSAKQSRSFLLKAARKFDEPIPGMRAGVNGKLASAVDQSMEDALASKGRTDLLQKWRDANQLTRENKQTFNESVVGALEDASPEKAYKVLTASGTDLDDIRMIKQHVGQDTFDAMAGKVVQNLVDDATAKDGTFDAKRFSVSLDKLSRDGRLSEILSEPTVKELYNLRDEARSIKAPGGLKTSVLSPLNFGATTSLMSATFLHSLPTALATAGGAAGTMLLAKILTSPEGVMAFRNILAKYGGNVMQATAEMSRLLKANAGENARTAKQKPTSPSGAPSATGSSSAAVRGETSGPPTTP